MSAASLIQGILAVAYPAIEPFVDTELVDAGKTAANFVADRVEATDNNWDNEGAEKLEKLFTAVADQLKARREAHAAGGPTP